MPRQANILVLDDDVSRQKTLSAGLQDIGYRVTTATNWPEALALLGKQAFNIVIADRRLPGVSGVEILEVTKELNPEVAVIMMTDHADLETAASVVDEGAYGYIIEPEGRCELKTLVNNALREQELLIRNRKLVESLQRSNNSLGATNRALEQASRAKSDFLAKMSHELRTPLNVIIGFAQLMLDQVPGEVNKEQRQCLDDILTSGQHLLGLINEVLDLAKVEAGKVKVRLKNVALPEVVESVTSAMMPVLSPKGQSLDFDLDKELPQVQTDEARLRQVFFNLLSNASKFTPYGGRLKIRAMRKGNWCQVNISDNGIGIKKEDMKQIFEPFYQVDNSMIDNSLVGERKGTGLGLALVKEIIELHGGRIWVESEYGKGSSFIFTLPLVAANKSLTEGTSAEEDTDSGR
jgi:signal transduction histidine kinase